MVQYNEKIIYLNLDKAVKVCKECKALKLRKRTISNRKEVMQKISDKEIDILMVSTTQDKPPKYQSYCCALQHYNYPCMEECLIKPQNLPPLKKCYMWNFIMGKKP